MRLATKLAVSLTVSIFLVVAVHGALSGHRTIQRLERAHSERLIARANLLAEVAEESLRKDGEEKARWLLRHSSDAVDGGRVTWIDPHPGPPPGFRGSPEDWAALQQGNGVGPIRDAEGRFIVVYRSVRNEGTLFGVVALETSTTETRLAVEEAIWNASTIAVLLAAVCALVIFLATWRLVGRPLAEIREQVRRIASDDLTGRLRVRARDQLGELASDMNELTTGLELAYQRVENETRQRVAAMSQLRHAGRLKVVGQLTASVAHEMGTPLNVVAGRARMIARGVATGEKAVESALIIERQAERMTERIRTLLGFARRRKVTRTRVDLKRVSEEAVELLGPLTHRATVEVSLEVAEGGRYEVEGDPSELEQVLVNLMTNAVQAMEGGGHLWVRLGVRGGLDGKPGQVVAEVVDDGPGMSEDVRQRVFEPFYTTKVDTEGTGLGLSVSSDIVNEHRGTLEVTSAPGEGATFTLSLPAMAPSPAQAAATPPDTTPPPEAG